MINPLAKLFISPILLTGFGKVLLIFPLCLSISIVYKATRLERLREMPSAVLGLWITIVVGMYGVGVGLWLLYLVMV
ncbi:MAG: hypothetical protein V3W34_00680 [Phycisphaerae bacterium]